MICVMIAAKQSEVGSTAIGCGRFIFVKRDEFVPTTDFCVSRIRFSGYILGDSLKPRKKQF